MPEASCHYQHRNFNPGQQCVHCDYQEPYMDDYKRDLKNLMENLFEKMYNKSDNPMFIIGYVDKEQFEWIKESIWDKDPKDVLEDFINLFIPMNP